MSILGLDLREKGTQNIKSCIQYTGEGSGQCLDTTCFWSVHLRRLINSRSRKLFSLSSNYSDFTSGNEDPVFVADYMPLRSNGMYIMHQMFGVYISSDVVVLFVFSLPASSSTSVTLYFHISSLMAWRWLFGGRYGIWWRLESSLETEYSPTASL